MTGVAPIIADHTFSVYSANAFYSVDGFVRFVLTEYSRMCLPSTFRSIHVVGSTVLEDSFFTVGTLSDVLNQRPQHWADRVLPLRVLLLVPRWMS